VKLQWHRLQRDIYRSKSTVKLYKPEGAVPDQLQDYLSVCAIVKNEGAYIREWVEFHLLVGVEKFYIYDNGCEDNTLEVLQPYVDEGVMEVIPWQRFLDESNPQYLAYGHCVRYVRERSFWLACIDLDEFLFSPKEDDVKEVLRTLEKAPAVAAFWRNYGFNGHQTRPDGLVIANYVVRPEYPSRSKNKFKSITQPRFAKGVSSAHKFKLYEGEIVNETGAPIEKTGKDRLLDDSVELLRVNHYITRSRAEYDAKIQRGTFSARKDLNDKYAGIVAKIEATSTFKDTNILRFVPELEKRIAARNTP
jgi:Glycosyltransferase family 92